MFIIKPITTENAKVIEKFMSDDLLGITSLPRNKRFLHQKLNASLSSFSKTIENPKNENYFFVLENVQTGEIGGICGIESKCCVENSGYTFKIEKIPAPETELPIPRKQMVLHLNCENNGPTEICSLYILPSFRKEGLGRLLSLSRFLFIAAFPSRFENKIIAEMRGYADDKHKSPFWDGVGKHFLTMEFEEIMEFIEEIRESIPNIAPKYPIYVSLIDEAAQDAIGRVHFDTQPALNMLMQEGFTLTNEIDLFDGGPKIECATHEVRTIKHSRVATIIELSQKPIQSESYIICNNSLHFACCYGCLTIIDENQVIIPSEVARLLAVNQGDLIRYVVASSKNSREHSYV